MKEYCIFIRYGSACPYRTSPYTSFEKAKQALLLMVEDYEYKNKFFYIDNDFFENKFPLTVGSIYYQIQEREVCNWEKYKKDTNEIKNNNCKILKFHK